MLTYNQIIKISREFQQSHHVLKNFGNGQDFDEVLHNAVATYKYPIMWMIDSNSPYTEGIESFSFRVVFMSPVNQLKEQGSDLLSSNINEVKSDMIQCANDFIAYWVNQTDAYDTLALDKNVNRETFEDWTADKLTGCSIDIRFYQPFDYNECSIPMGTPTSLVTCAPVYIYEDGILVDTVASGGSYSYASGGGIASQTFNGGAVTDQNSGTTKAITVKDSGGNNVGTKGTDTALALAITVDDVTVDNSNVTYTVDITAEGVFELPDTTVQLQVDGVNYGAPVSIVTLDPNAILEIQW